VRRLLTWIVVTLGIAAIARRLRRRSGPDEIVAADVQDPADELRRKLAQSRSEDETSAAAPAAPEASVAQPTVDERRANVHEEGRATIDAMREPDEG
jgi:hypothetical protein